MASRMALCPHDVALCLSSPFAAGSGRRRRSSSVRVLAVASSAK
jgi:hypothetical protein